MAFLCVTPLKESIQDISLHINKKYEQYLNSTHIKYTLSNNTILYVDAAGFAQDTYYKSIKGNIHIFDFGLPILRKQHSIETNPIAGVYCRIRDDSSTITIEADALGYYPVFYTQTKDAIVISDKQEYIAAMCKRSLTLDKISIVEFCIAELINGNRSFFEGVKRLATDELIQLSKNGARIQQKFHPLLINVTTNELLNHYEEVVQGIESRFEAFEVKLSGGYDSRLNLCFLLKYATIPKYCITYPTNKFDISIAANIASHYNIEHYVLNSDLTAENYRIKHYGHNNAVITGQCGELSRSFYYNRLKRIDDLSGFINYYFPYSKRYFLNVSHKKIILSSVLSEVEILAKKYNYNNELYRVYDWIYLNRARTTFAFQVTDLSLSLFQIPLLVDEYWFRHRLSFSFNEIQSRKNYYEVYESLDDYISRLPFKPFSLFNRSNILVNLNKISKIYYKGLKDREYKEDYLGIFPEESLMLINNHPNIKVNYKRVLATIDYVERWMGPNLNYDV
jgi:hypothetical protein